MKKYAFKLQTVLDMRAKVLEKKQLEMAEVVGILNAQIQKREDLLSKKENSKQSLEAIYESEEELDIFGITNYKNFLGKITNDVRIQDGIIDNTRIILKGKQLEVNEAYKEVKVLEKLKEKQEKTFLQNYMDAQAKELDDIASTRFKRIPA